MRDLFCEDTGARDKEVTKTHTRTRILITKDKETAETRAKRLTNKRVICDIDVIAIIY